MFALMALASLVPLANCCTKKVSVLTQVIIEATDKYKTQPRIEWVRAWPGQAVLCVSQLYWTMLTHEAIRGGQKVGNARMTPSMRRNMRQLHR